MEVLFDFIGNVWDFVYGAWYVFLFGFLFVIVPVSALWEKNKKLAIGVVSLVVIVAVIVVPKYYESKQVDIYAKDLSEIVDETSTFGLEFDDAYVRYEDGKMTQEQFSTMIDKFVVKLELSVQKINELKTPSEFEKFSQLQIQLDLKTIELYKKMAKDMSMYGELNSENYYEEYAEWDNIWNEISIELANLEKNGLLSNE